jgi:ferredoxin
MAVRVQIDPNLCIGSAECNRLVPDGFRLDEDLGISAPLPGAGLVDRKRLAAAAAGCPTGAITIAADEDEIAR